MCQEMLAKLKTDINKVLNQYSIATTEFFMALDDGYDKYKLQNESEPSYLFLNSKEYRKLSGIYLSLGIGMPNAYRGIKIYTDEQLEQFKYL